MLRGNSETKVDDKGRLKVPAAFQKVLNESFPGGVFFVTSLDGKSARVYPLTEWTKIESKFNSSFNGPQSRLKHKVNFWGGEVEADNQGRLLLPQRLREDLKMLGDVSVLGMVNYLEVITSNEARRLAEEPFTEADLKEIGEMGI